MEGPPRFYYLLFFQHALCNDCGVAHLDIRPSNIYFTRDREVKLVGLGLAISDRRSVPAPAVTATGPWRWLWLTVVPFAALMMIVALQPPGILWLEEGLGYDVLEYHLQTPKEYYLSGAITYLPHSLYAKR